MLSMQDLGPVVHSREEHSIVQWETHRTQKCSEMFGGENQTQITQLHRRPESTVLFIQEEKSYGRSPRGIHNSIIPFTLRCASARVTNPYFIGQGQELGIETVGVG